MIKIYLKIETIFLCLLYYYFKIIRKKIGNYPSFNNAQRIGFIDQDGLIHVPTKYHNHFNLNDLYFEGDFLCRDGSLLNVIIEENVILLEKKFRNKYFDFINELRILHHLRNVDCVPKIHYVDYKNKSLIINYIDGYILREKIAKCGALVRDIDLKSISENKSESKEYADLETIMKLCVSKQLRNQILNSIEQIHEKGVIIYDIKIGNIIIKPYKSFIIDFNHSRFHKFMPKYIINILKKMDIELLNETLH